MTFSSDLAAFNRKAQERTRKIFVNTVAHVYESIVDGSNVTGAPGQPVDTGNLRNSFTTDFLEPLVARVATNVEYAPSIEYNTRGANFRNHGPHSVELTRAGIQQIVDYETAKVNE